MISFHLNAVTFSYSCTHGVPHLTQSNRGRQGHPPAALFVLKTNKGKHQKHSNLKTHTDVTSNTNKWYMCMFLLIFHIAVNVRWWWCFALLLVQWIDTHNHQYPPSIHKVQCSTCHPVLLDRVGTVPLSAAGGVPTLSIVTLIPVPF